MIDITRNTDVLAGPLDGVTANVDCMVVDYELNGDNPALSEMFGAKDDKCHLMASSSTGFMSVSLREKGVVCFISIRDVLDLLFAAAEAAGYVPEEDRDD